jgi:RNA polymerase subunit RPABC4/transcription elongation factor Spt4
MIQCHKCGQSNDRASNFCRFCGFSFAVSPTPAPHPLPSPQNYENAAPRPYSWKTDEFSTDATKILGSRPAFQNQGASNMRTQPDLSMQPFQPQQVAAGYHCPQCHSRLFPRRERRISTGGWVVFGVLMFAFFPLFWIGLLIREDVNVCPVCKFKSLVGGS